MKKFLFTILLAFSISFSFGQRSSRADSLLLKGNFYEAYKSYLSSLKEFPDDPKVNYGAAVSLLNTELNKSKALDFLNRSNESVSHDFLYYLGRSQALNYQFDQAISTFSKYKVNGKGNSKLLKDVNHQIEYCYNAKELIKFPADVDFENLGSAVNSEYDDYNPFISNDESFLIYNSRRDSAAGKDELGRIYSDVYISNIYKGEWDDAVPVQVINSPLGNEEVVGISPIGNSLIFHLADERNQNELSISPKEQDQIFPPQPLSLFSANEKVVERSASLSPDGKTVYFSSNRKGGLGGLDIYRSVKMPDGKWSEPLNLGPVINTPYDEDFPLISPDGTVLYFSSKGHLTMGGYDIFKATVDEASGSWKNLRNIGYPINDPDDNINLCVSKSGRYGYISSPRQDSRGGLDIYRVVFKEIDPEVTLIKGFVADIDGDEIREKVTINVYNHDKLFGTYVPNRFNHKFVMILPPGKYNMEIALPDYKTHTEHFEVYGKGSFQTELVKDLILLSKAGK